MMSPLVTNITYSLACVGAGAGLSDLLRRPTERDGEPISLGTLAASHFLLGQSLLAALWLVLGLLGQLNATWVFACCLLSFMAGARFIKEGAKAIPKGARDLGSSFWQDTLPWKLVALASTFLMFASAFSLPSRLSGDGMSKYLVLPKLFAHTHRLAFLPGLEGWSQLGFQGELHSAALLLLTGSDTTGIDAARLFASVTIAGGAFMLLGIVTQVGLGSRSLWLSLGMVFSSSAIIQLSGSGKMDQYAAAPALGAVFWALRAQQNKQKGLMPVIGILAGTSIVAKFIYLMTLVPCVVLILIWPEVITCFRARRLQFTGPFITAAKFSLWTMIGLLPHFLKNQTLFHSPLVPFTSPLGQFMQHLGNTNAHLPQILLFYPFVISFTAYYGCLSPLILALLPLGLSYRPREPFDRGGLAAITASAVLALLIWLSKQASLIALRYHLGPLLLFVLPAAAGAESACRRSRVLSTCVASLSCLLLLSVAGYWNNQNFFLKNGLKRLLSIENVECVSGYPTWCDPAHLLNRVALSQARILILSEYRLEFRPELIQNSSGAEDYIAIYGKSSSGERWGEIRRRGFRYIVRDLTSPDFSIVPLDKSVMTFAPGGIDVDDPPNWVKVEKLWDQDHVAVFKLAYEDVVDPKPSLNRSLRWNLQGPFRNSTAISTVKTSRSFASSRVKSTVSSWKGSGLRKGPLFLKLPAFG